VNRVDPPVRITILHRAENPTKGIQNSVFSDTAGIHTVYFCISIPTLRRVKLGFTPSVLNTETRSSETTVSTSKTTQYQNAEDYNLSIHFSYLPITSIGKIIRCNTNRSDSTSRLLHKEIWFWQALPSSVRICKL
jgi:hypothetical protein